MNHPENDGSRIITPHSEELLKSAETCLRHAKYKYWATNAGKFVIYSVMTYGGATAFIPRNTETEE